MFYHIGLKVADLAKASRFYDVTLKSLAIAKCWSVADQIGY
ncbi:hypothetical protein [Inquilinus sp. CAU 1745]